MAAGNSFSWSKVTVLIVVLTASILSSSEVRGRVFRKRQATDLTPPPEGSPPGGGGYDTPAPPTEGGGGYPNSGVPSGGYGPPPTAGYAPPPSGEYGPPASNNCHKGFNLTAIFDSFFGIFNSIISSVLQVVTSKINAFNKGLEAIHEAVHINGTEH